MDRNRRIDLLKAWDREAQNAWRENYKDYEAWRDELTEEEQAVVKEWDAETPVEAIRELERTVCMTEVAQTKDRGRGVIRRVCVARK